MSILAPIAFFAYNRPEHTRRALAALSHNDLASESELWLFSDHPKHEGHGAQVAETRKVLDEVTGFRAVHRVYRSENYGLARNVIEGVGGLMERYGRAIVLEDDLLTSPRFLGFMNQVLDHYAAEEKVFSVGGFSFPPDKLPMPEGYAADVYFSLRNTSWGWATWRNRWEKIDWNIRAYGDALNNKARMKQFRKGGDDLPDLLERQVKGEIDSWAIRFSYAQFTHQAFTVLPVYSHILNMGLDGSGTHSNVRHDLASDLRQAKLVNHWPDVVAPDAEILKRFKSLYYFTPSIRMKNFVKKIIGYESLKRSLVSRN